VYIYILYLSIATTHLPKARRHPRHRKSPGACLWTPLFGSSNSLHLAEQLAVLQSAAYVGFTARNLPFADGLFIRLHGDFGDGLLMFIVGLTTITTDFPPECGLASCALASERIWSSLELQAVPRVATPLASCRFQDQGISPLLLQSHEKLILP
jgi:hypothetical protein